MNYTIDVHVAASRDKVETEGTLYLTEGEPPMTRDDFLERVQEIICGQQFPVRNGFARSSARYSDEPHRRVLRFKFVDVRMC